MKSESAQTRDLCRKLEALGCSTYPLIGSRWSPIGWPDRYIDCKDFQCFIEFKAAGKWLRPGQYDMCKRLHLKVYVVVLPDKLYSLDKKLCVFNNVRELYAVLQSHA